VYVLRTRHPDDRDRVVERLRADGIPSRPYFSPIHLQPFYRAQFGYAEGAFRTCEDWGARAVAVPFSSVMTVEQVDIVCRSLRRTLEE
jgi:dTDP-4-amino-4,6-dideoxygalactose transaminase